MSLSVLPFNKNAKDSFLGLFKNEQFALEKLKQSAILSNIFNHLAGLDVNAMVVEDGYRDRDFLEDFAAYYARCYHPYSRNCRRIHFFEFPTDILSDPGFVLRTVADDGDPPNDVACLQAAYRGFMVCRPLPAAQVGRTVLVPPKGNPRKKTRRNHFPCLVKCPVNLMGVPLLVEGLAFQEQDSVIAACATVALWTAFQKTSDLFRTQQTTPAQITAAAATVAWLRRPIPSSALSVQQMCAAIRQFGMEPEIITLTPDVPVLSLLYAYLKLGLPVILGVKFPDSRVDEDPDQDHALTVNGFSIEDSAVLRREVATPKGHLPMSGRRISAFYAHDDQLSPYVPLEPVESRPSKSVSPVFLRCTTPGPRGPNTILTPRRLILPLYHKIRVRFLDVYDLLLKLNSVYFSYVFEGAGLEWDIHLTTTNDYKANLKKSQNTPGKTLPREAFLGLLTTQHPRFLWRVAVCLRGQCLVELLLDATDMPRSTPIYRISWYRLEMDKPRALKLLEDVKVHDKLLTLFSPEFYRLLQQSLK